MFELFGILSLLQIHWKVYFNLGVWVLFQRGKLCGLLKMALQVGSLGLFNGEEECLNEGGTELVKASLTHKDCGSGWQLKRQTSQGIVSFHVWRRC